MRAPIINFQDWLATPPGLALLDWEQAQMDAAVADVFGYHALQLGLPSLNALQANRIAHQWTADRQNSLHDGVDATVHLRCDFEALPFPEASLDLVVLPHVLEHSIDAHDCLREAARVLRPEGKLVISGFNPNSLWGWKYRRERFYQGFGACSSYLPGGMELLGYWRLRDWLRLLNFEVVSSNFGLWQPAVHSESMLARLAWMNKLGKKFWPVFGAAYSLVAVKRVAGLRMLKPAWHRIPQRSGAPAQLVPKASEP
jgi:SAM-dependent methyltransferase